MAKVQMTIIKLILILLITVLVLSIVFAFFMLNINTYTTTMEISASHLQSLSVNVKNGVVKIFQWNGSYILVKVLEKYSIIKPRVIEYTSNSMLIIKAFGIMPLNSQVYLTIYIPKSLHLQYVISLINGQVGLNIMNFTSVSVSIANGKVYGELEQGRGLTASMGNGETSLDIANISSFSIHIGNGEVNIDDLSPITSGIYSVFVGNGNVNINLNPESSIFLNATAGNGIVNVKGLSFKSITSSSQHQFSGILGSGEASMSITVGNGDVSISQS
ncbi:hypothetical protein EWF20_05460 [Sulfolobus sp. S-194]|uniref:DUF4097 domain-containing protein n=1 Tax=Sulfolobus sp. S-194 TaxID=2512240 RepID=UPI00143718D9|nr:DUF4097 domain-containing protein [Sulfolobus sp. S-194]QIW23659.1 hypothetical protein EWF20_05460 [Sulfolobus sp. S-194]